MSTIRKIAILLHQNERTPLDPRYIASAMSESWREMDIEVEVVIGIDGSVEADLWLPHVDLTVIPSDYQRYLAECPRVVNRDVVDISKRRISELLVRPGDGYTGPIIVKSNANYGGRPERRLLGDDRAAHARWLGAGLSWLRRRVGLRGGVDLTEPLDPRHYPIFESPAALPPSAFENPELVVERFLPERQGELYVLRSYAFGGDAAVNIRSTSKDPVVKAGNSIDREHVPVPNELLEIRESLGIDYGKLDYVLNEGRIRLLDVNRTPTFGRMGNRYSEDQRRTALEFARGLIEYFEKQSVPSDAASKPDPVA